MTMTIGGIFMLAGLVMLAGGAGLALCAGVGALSDYLEDRFDIRDSLAMPLAVFVIGLMLVIIAFLIAQVAA